MPMAQPEGPASHRGRVCNSLAFWSTQLPVINATSKREISAVHPISGLMGMLGCLKRYVVPVCDRLACLVLLAWTSGDIQLKVTGRQNF